MMNPEAAFVRAILADPGADAPRLVYADWLEEQGDPRGEFIRVQCELAQRPEADPQCPWLEEREQALLAEHGERWQQPIRALLAGSPQRQCQMWFRRGFVEEMAVNAPLFLAHAQPLFQLTPLRRLCLVNVDRHIPDLAALPVLDHLPLLHLFTSRRRAAVIASARTSGLAVLDVCYPISMPGDCRVLDSPPFRYSVKCGRNLMETLFSSPRLCRVFRTVAGGIAQSPEQARFYLRVFPQGFEKGGVWAIAHPAPEPEHEDPAGEWRVEEVTLLLLFKDRPVCTRVKQSFPVDLSCQEVG